ncbi:MAG: transposase [Spirochaetes bacterium]|nr:transposase [Spirochaetota bacterium]
MDYKKGTDRNQLLLFNECIDNLVDKNNPVRIIDAYVESLSLKKIGFKTPEMKTGTTPYSNKLLLKIYMYAYMNKIRGSRPIVRECKRNKEMIWLTEGLEPCFKTIADFRCRNKKHI